MQMLFLRHISKYYSYNSVLEIQFSSTVIMVY